MDRNKIHALRDSRGRLSGWAEEIADDAPQAVRHSELSDAELLSAVARANRERLEASNRF